MNQLHSPNWTDSQPRSLVETRAQILADCLRVLIAMTALALVCAPIAFSSMSLGLYLLGFLPFFFVYGVGLFLLRSGRAQASAWLTVLGTMVLQTFANFFNPGLEGQALVSFLNLILIAGFTIGRSAALLTTGVAAVCVGSYINWMGRGALPEPLVVPNTYSLIVTTCVTITATGGIVMVVLKHVGLALIREREALTQVQQAQRMEAIGRLSAGVAHDFNNLLTVILGGVEMAQRKRGLDEPIGDELSNIHRATMRATALTQKMMAFQSNRSREGVATDIRAALRELEPVLRQSLPASVELRSPALDVEAWVMAERLELEQIILNLVHNARDAMEGSGEIQLQLSLEDATDRILLSVADNGRGMSSETQARIFEPFFTTRSATGGHGLGLTGVYALVQRLGGQISVESTLGSGTTFTVALPRAQATETATPPEPRPRSTPERPPTASGAHRILLVDDNSTVREVLVILLEETGAEVTALETGHDALELLSRDPHFDLLISDVLMPEMDGYQLLGRIRESGHHLPAIMVSGFDPSRPENDADLMPYRRLAKPFTQTNLMACIRSLLPDDHPTAEPEC